MRYYDFRSDNTGGAAPEVVAALIGANVGTAPSYGEDAHTASLRTRASAVFEREVDVFPVASGTAANALAIAAITVPWGSVYCHESAHVHNAECGATEFFTGGAKVVPLSGDHFLMDSVVLRSVLDRGDFGVGSKLQPCAVSITQPSDYGTVYSIAALRSLTTIARAYGLRVHMDGARLANAIAYLRCSPADVTWKSGIDILSLGATKNGALSVDAIIVFDRELSRNLTFRMRRAGHVFSKMRFASAQLCAYFENDLWLENARRANAAAVSLADGIQGISGVSLVAPVQGNEVFLRVEEAVAQGLEGQGFLFFRRPRNVIRLVCRYDTTRREVRAFTSTLRSICLSRDSSNGVVY